MNQAPANTFKLNGVPIFLLKRIHLYNTRFNKAFSGRRFYGFWFPLFITSNCSSREEITVAEPIKWRWFHAAQSLCVVLCRPVCLFPIGHWSFQLRLLVTTSSFSYKWLQSFGENKNYARSRRRRTDTRTDVHIFIPRLWEFNWYDVLLPIIKH